MRKSGLLFTGRLFSSGMHEMISNLQARQYRHFSTLDIKQEKNSYLLK
jgi:hypothetical protein